MENTMPVAVPGGSLEVRIGGGDRTGPTLVFTHYWGGSADTWDEVIGHLPPGQPTVRFDQRVLLEAKRLLAHTDLPVTGCARRLGFRDAGNFSTFFRRQTGTPPATWRAAYGTADASRT